jgi:hypothetical protein
VRRRVISVGTTSDRADVPVNLEVAGSINLAGEVESVAALAATLCSRHTGGFKGSGRESVQARQ